MKKFILSACMAVLTVATSFAQSSEGHITYSVDVSSDDPNMAMAVSMMQGASLEVSFKGEQSYTMMSMGAMMTMKTITSESGDVLMLMDGMMGSKAIKTTMEELEAAGEGEEDDLEVTLVDETKSIAGYDCKKAVVTDEDGNEIIFWYTDKLVSAAKTKGNMNGKIPGTSLAFEANQGGMIMSYKATKVETSVDDSIFDMTIPSGYEEMTFEDFSKMGM